MSSKKKNDSFSFDNDPGKLSGDDDVDFTFTDIPILGSAKKKDVFSFDDLPEDKSDPSLASFEALLTEQPKTDGARLGKSPEDVVNFDATASSMDVQRIMNSRGAKKKKLILLCSAVGAIILLAVLGISLFMGYSEPKKEETKKTLTAANKAKIAKKKREEKIASMLKSAEGKINSDKPKEALAAFNKIIKMDSKCSAAYMGLGKCYEKMKDINSAEEQYRKAIDLNSSSSATYTLLAEILIRSDKTDQAQEILATAHEKFPNDSAVSLKLADIYYDINQKEEALALYNSVKSRSSFPEKSIIKYIDLLKKDSRKKAKELLLYAGKKFKSAPLFISASKIASAPSEKVKTLTQALKNLPEDNKQLNEIRFLLAEAQVENNQKAEATATMKTIDLTKLDKEYTKNLVDLATKAGMVDIKDYCLKLLESNPEEIALQQTILKELAQTQSPEDLLAIYSTWWKKNTREPIANYLYALALGDSRSAKKYFQDAAVLKPDFYEAIIELAKIDIRNNNLASAESHLKKAIALQPDKKAPRKLLAITQTMRGQGRTAIKKYAKFLSSKGVTGAKQASALLDIAMLMSTPGMADKYLSQIKKDPSLFQEYREKNVKRKLIFGGVTSADFAGAKTEKLRQYYIIYLFSKGRYNDLMKLRTSKKEFPEFWKIYLMRKKNINTWKTLAKLYHEKNAVTGDPAKLITIAMWEGKISLEGVEKKIKEIPQDKKGLIYALIAEEYFREKKKTKATIRFKKAIKAPKSIYNGVIKHIYNSHKRQ